MTNPIALDLLKLAEQYLSALHGSVARHDNIGLNLSCGGCALRDEIRDVLPKLAAAVSVPPPAPRADDQAALRQRIADELRAHASLGGVPPRYELPFFDGATPSLPRISGWRPLDDVADAVLAVLPEPADQAAVCICGHTEAQHFEDVCVTEVTGCDCGDFLTGEAAREVIARWRDAAIQARADRAVVFREAANALAAVGLEDSLVSGPRAWAEAIETLRRLADEAQPAKPDRCPHGCDTSTCPCLACEADEEPDGGPCVAGEQQNETPTAKACPHNHTWPDRSVCLPPCGAMHERCVDCETAVDDCPNDAAGARQDGAQP